MSRKEVVIEVVAFAACLAVFLGAWLVFGAGELQVAWVAVYVAAYLVLAAVRLAWRRRRSGTTPG